MSSPFRIIPISCVDHFYEDPHAIREYALSLDYPDNDGNFPGSRTKCLDHYSVDLFQTTMNKILSLFFDGEFKWHGTLQFQKIYPFHDDPNHILNQGEIHTDLEMSVAGLIYLNPDPRPDSGTSMYQIKKEFEGSYNTIPDDSYLGLKAKCYRGKRVSTNLFDQFTNGKCEEYENALEKHNSHFEKTIEVKNVFNRLVAYTHHIPHAQTNLYMAKDDFRLTQVFFFDKIEVTNPYSGQSISLTEEENKIYLSVKLAELMGNYKLMQKQISKFSRLNPKAYMVLLD